MVIPVTRMPTTPPPRPNPPEAGERGWALSQHQILPTINRPTMNKYALGLIIFSIIDVTYTAIGALYGGGGAELNPLFSWIHDPLFFIAFVSVIKIIAISGIILLLYYLERNDKTEIEKRWTRFIGVVANISYSCLLLGCVGANVLYLLSKGI